MIQISLIRFLIIILAQSIIMIFSCRYLLAEEIEQRNETVEPILIEETLPNEVGEWDIRFNFDYTKIDEEINVTLPQFQLFFGLLDNLGAEISLPLKFRKVEKVDYGIGSISTSLKWLFCNQSYIIPALVLGLEIGFPTNSLSGETEERAYELSPYIAFLKDFGQLNVQGNLAQSTEFPVSGGEVNYRTEFNIAFIYPVFGEKVNLLAELNNSWLTKEHNELWIAPGIKYNINDEQFLAFSVPVALNKQSSGFRLILQYQIQL